MLAIIKSCLSPLLPYAKLDECFIKLLLFQHPERQINCPHVMALPPEVHTLIINVKLAVNPGCYPALYLISLCLILIYSDSPE